jgi:membrane-bound serine protease (ClpP class)
LVSSLRHSEAAVKLTETTPTTSIIPTTTTTAAAAAASTGDNKKVLWIELNEPITTASVQAVEGAIQEASSGGYYAILISLDTFGGSAESAFKIADSLESSPVPVIGYVYPPGSQALGAGTMILMATDYTAMAPGSAIGSSRPILGLGSTNEAKFVIANTERLVSHAEIRQRNSTQIARFVTDNDSNLRAEQALKYHVIELISNSPKDLLKQANGSEIKNMARKNEFRFDTAGATLVRYEPGISVNLLEILSDPIIFTVLISIGILTLVLGISSPGFRAEIVGITLLILGLVGQGFNVNWVAMVLMGIGAALIVIELHLHGFGVSGIIGITALAFGMMLLVSEPAQPMLVNTDYISHIIRISTLLLIPFSGLFGFVMYKAYKATQIKTLFTKFPTGNGRALDDISPSKEGYVVIEGEYWKAKSSVAIKAGSDIMVVGHSNGILSIEPVTTKHTDFR